MILIKSSIQHYPFPTTLFYVSICYVPLNYALHSHFMFYITTDKTLPASEWDDLVILWEVCDDSLVRVTRPRDIPSPSSERVANRVQALEQKEINLILVFPVIYLNIACILSFLWKNKTKNGTQVKRSNSYLDKVLVSQGISDIWSHSRHDPHTGDSVRAVCQLDAYLWKRWPNGTHAKWHDVHRAT